jgi:hypothetical protein
MEVRVHVQCIFSFLVVLNRKFTGELSGLGTGTISKVLSHLLKQQKISPNPDKTTHCSCIKTGLEI